MKTPKTVLSGTAKRKPGPKPTGVGTLVGVRLQLEDLARLDAYVERSEEPMSRPEAIRAVLREHLGSGTAARAHPTPRGPATEAVKAMDDAIKSHRLGKKSGKAKS